MGKFIDYLNEGKDITVNIDFYMPSKEDDEYKDHMKVIDQRKKKYKIKLKIDTSDETADATGTKENLIKFLKDSGYDDMPKELR